MFIQNFGDTDPIANGGRFLYVEEDGKATVEVLEEPCDDAHAFGERECKGEDPCVPPSPGTGTFICEGCSFEHHCPHCPGEARLRWKVYRYDLDKMKRVTVANEDGTDTVYVVSDAYQATWSHPVSSYPEWFMADLERVASSTDSSREDLIEQLCSDDPKERLWAYREIEGFHGLDNFDQYPIELSRTEVEARYKEGEI